MFAHLRGTSDHSSQSITFNMLFAIMMSHAAISNLPNVSNLPEKVRRHLIRLSAC